VPIKRLRSDSPMSGHARIHPAETRKSSEIGIRRIEDITALHRKHSQMGIGRKVTRGAELFELCAKPCEVTVRRLGDVNMGQRQPGIKPIHDVLNRKWARHHPAVRGDAHETQDRRPCQSDAFCARQTRIPPEPRSFVNRRISVVRVNEDVYVGQNHGFCPRKLPSPAHRRAARACRGRYPA